jgi:acyl-CoA thioester hydrolase
VAKEISTKITSPNVLQEETEVVVRFNEADPLGIVWHGHYIRYFEDGREAFGRRYGLSYLDFYQNGLAVPVVSVQCDYKKPLRYGERVIVRCFYENSPAAKLKFQYKIFEADTQELVAAGSSVQVFVDPKSFQLLLTLPEFFESWKKKWNIS